MVSFCQTCGDRGFANALIICRKCRSAAQHRYCSGKLSFAEDVDWFCEDCEPIYVDLDKSTEVPLRKSERLKEKQEGAIKSKPGLKRTQNGTHSAGQCAKHRCNSPSMIPQMVGTNFELNAQLIINIDDSPSLSEKIKRKPTSCKSQSEALEHMDGLPLRLMQENQCNLAKEAEITEAKACQKAPVVQCEILDDCSEVLAQPILEPIWRGQFDICNKATGKKFDVIEGLAAHLSNKACLKVSEEAKLLPVLLFLDMVPRSAVWPKSFQISRPSDNNIALYIFPGSPVDENVYDCLVDDMVDGELAMKAVVENAELLVFASTDLPLRFWRFQGKRYLWGVFRGKQEKQVSYGETREPSSIHYISDE